MSRQTLVVRAQTQQISTAKEKGGKKPVGGLGLIKGRVRGWTDRVKKFEERGAVKVWLQLVLQVGRKGGGMEEGTRKEFLQPVAGRTGNYSLNLGASSLTQKRRERNRQVVVER